MVDGYMGFVILFSFLLNRFESFHNKTFFLSLPCEIKNIININLSYWQAPSWSKGHKTSRTVNTKTVKDQNQTETYGKHSVSEKLNKIVNKRKAYAPNFKPKVGKHLFTQRTGSIYENSIQKLYILDTT